MHSNHLKATPSLRPMETLSSTKHVPDAERVGNHCFKEQSSHTTLCLKTSMTSPSFYGKKLVQVTEDPICYAA